MEGEAKKCGQDDAWAPTVRELSPVQNLAAWQGHRGGHGDPT